MAWKKYFTVRILLVCSGALLFCIGCGVKNKEQEGKKESHSTLSTIMDSLNLEKEDLSILIDKSDYKLYLRADSASIKEYPVVFGPNPVDDKLMQGDRATPEGHFKVRDFYPHKSWSKFIWIDYPTNDSWKKHKKAKLEHSIPQDAKIGGEIGIHGVPNGNSDLIYERTNWTLGCISLTNEDVNELYTVIYKGMPIDILP